MPFRDVFEAQRARVERAVAEPRRSHISKWINFGFENASPEFEWDGIPSEVSRRMGAVLPLSTENVTWRRFGEDDRVALTKILCDATVMRWVFTGGPLTNSEASAFIDANFLEGGGDTPGMDVLCRRGDENVIGFAGIIPCKWPLEGQAEFGVVLHAEVQNMRYGHEIGKKLIAVAHRDLGLKRVYALCHPENAASIRWLANIGMAATELVIPNYHGSEPRRVFMIEKWE
jgi:RimJ/RimL family protein N-acetyltransferase